MPRDWVYHRRRKIKKQAPIGEKRAREICDAVAHATGIKEAQVLRLPAHIARWHSPGDNKCIVTGKLEVSSGDGDNICLDYFYLHQGHTGDRGLVTQHVYRYPYEGTSNGFWLWLRDHINGERGWTKACGDVDLKVLPSQRRRTTNETLSQYTIGSPAHNISSISTNALETESENSASLTRALSTSSSSSSTDPTIALSCPFYRLPTEVRDRIYQHASRFDGLIVKIPSNPLFADTSREIILAPQIAAVAQAGKKLREEVNNSLACNFTCLPSLYVLPPSDVSHLDKYKAYLRPWDVVCFSFQDTPNQDSRNLFRNHLKSWLSIRPVRILFNAPSHITEMKDYNLFMEGIHKFINWMQEHLTWHMQGPHYILKRTLRLHNKFLPIGQSEFILYYELNAEEAILHCLRDRAILHCLRDREGWAEHAIIKDFAKPSAGTAVMHTLGWTGLDSGMITSKERDVLGQLLPDMNRFYYPMPWK